MPYTPPIPRSPALASPELNDSSLSKNLDSPRLLSPPRSPGSARPSLPRSSSFTKSQRTREALASENALHNASLSAKADLNTLNIDTGAAQKTMPFGDASNSSSDDDDPHKAEKVAELEHAVRESLIANGVSDKTLKNDLPSTDARVVDESHLSNVPVASDVPKLSHAARKISHSRSSTDSAIVFTPPLSASETPQRLSASDGSDEEADPSCTKPPFVRKKSGELVKPAIRPNMRRKHSSMPGTPTYGKKGVHFNDDIAQVRHFLQVDRPMAVSAGGSPVETFEEEPEFPFQRQESSQNGLDIRLSNFPRQTLERLSQPVRLDSLTLSADQKSLIGDVEVANLAFHKSVVVRFTLDQWRTTSEVSGQYNADIRRKPKNEGFDLFTFNIRLSDQANLEKRTMVLCVRYCVNGQDHWDNNGGENFQIEFSKKPTAVSATSSRVQTAQSTQSPPRSRKGSSPQSSQTHSQTQSSGPLRSKPSLDDDFSNGLELGSPFHFKRSASPQLPDAPPPRRHGGNASTQFSSRYDFGASLSAALSHAQAQLGDKSGIKRTDEPGKRSKTPPALARRLPDTSNDTNSPRADGLLANKQPLDSRAYQEFVSKFCFFGSGKPGSSTTSTQPAEPPKTAQQHLLGTDGQRDDMTSPQSNDSELEKRHRAKEPVPVAAPNNHSTTIKLSQNLFMARDSKSPTRSSTAASYDSRSASPASITLRYPQESHSGWFSSGTPTPPAIHG